MGRLLDGAWIRHDLGPDEQGRFVRRAARFRGELSTDGSTPFPAEPGRYRLYASRACPWTHRVLIVRALKGLEAAIPVTDAEPHMGPDGWTFPEGADPVSGARHAWELFVRARSDYTGRASLPVLWDQVAGTIVSNESVDLVRSLDRQCAAFAERPEPMFWPDHLDAAIRAEIDASYASLQDGVYRAGFAASQHAHTEAATAVRDRMIALDRHLADHRWLLGDRLTAADLTLFPTLYRFDAIYAVHFKCDGVRLVDLEHLWDWTRAVYQLPGVAATCDLEHAKQHYFTSHESIHPRRYVPIGPNLDFDAPTRR